MTLTLTPTLAARFSTTGGSAAAEIVAHEGGRFFVSNGAENRIDVFEIGTGLVGTIDLLGQPDYAPGALNAIAVKNGRLAVVYEGAPAGTVPQPGRLALFDAATLDRINLATVGFQPDMVTFSADGTELYVANEGEPRAGGDARGSVSIVTFPNGFDSLADVVDVGFRQFDGQEDALRALGVRIFPGVEASRDFEPEYIAVDPQTGDLFVTLQEANTVARIDRATLEVTLQPLGTVDNAKALGDFSDSDGGIVFRAGMPVFGLRMPDAIATFVSGSKTYYVTANEGDDRGEDVRLGDVVLDPTAFPNAAALQDDAVLGRLGISSIDGDTDGDGDFDEIYAYGGRSFTVFDETGTVVFDSRDAQVQGLDLELITALTAPQNWQDGRSDNKGPEPEGVAIGEIDGRIVAAIGAERTSGVFLYDLTDLGDVGFLGYIDGASAGDISPEGLAFISAADSATGNAQIAIAYEVSGTTAVYDLTFGAPQITAVINEFLFNPAGDDQNEFVEVLSAPFADLSSLWLLQIEGDGGGAGTVDTAINLDAADANGYWWTGFLAGEFENGAVTLLLVEDFTGSEGDDLDIDNDGVLDATPWGRVLDGVATADDAADRTYAEVTLNDVVGASRIPNGTDTDTAADWVENDANLAGIAPGVSGTPGFARNTPLALNEVIVAPPTPRQFDLRISEIWPGNEPGSNLTEDWFEVRNNGTAVWTTADGDLFFDDDSRSASNAVRLLGVTEIAPGEAVVFVDGGSAAAAEFAAIWGAALDLDDVKIGFYDGPGLGQGGDGVALFIENGAQGDDALDDGEELNFAAFPDANTAGGASFDVVAGAFSQVGVDGAVATVAVNDAGQPAIGSPGDAPALGTAAAFTLQLFHAADQEARATEVETIPNFSAVLNALRAQDIDGDGVAGYAHTLTLSSGDAYIPGLFFEASASVFGLGGIADILIQNLLGFQAIAFGNHEFDFGTGTVSNLIAGGTGTDQNGNPFTGTAFPYLSANIDVTTDANLAPLKTADRVAPLPNSIARSVVLTTDGGEKIGVVGAVTPTLGSISSPGDVTVLNPFTGTPTDAQLDQLAADIQAEVDALLALNPDVNKVILLAHMQQISIELALAGRLKHVDIIVAGGSNTRLFDADDIARPGDSDQGDYPTFVNDADGNPVAVVNTDGSYKYVGRLVIDFDENGVILPGSYDETISGAYATDDAGVARVGGEGLADPEIQEIVDLIGAQIVATDGNFFGLTDVFLEGRRPAVRQQETNLGNLTADANLSEARKTDPTVVVSIKNGGGIRGPIGEIVVPPGGDEFELLPPAGNPLSGRPEGGVSQNAIGNALSFNNGLTLLTLTAEELVAVLEHGVAVSSNDPANQQGRFPQVSGVRFSVDLDRPSGDRVVNAGIFTEDGKLVAELKRDGDLVGDPGREFRIVTLNFLAGGGDGYPFPQGDSADRVDLFVDANNDGRVDPPSEGGPVSGVATFAADGSEQDALAEYLAANFSVTPYAEADTGPELDTRIQNLAFRTDAVFAPGVAVTAIYDIQGAGHVSALVGQSVTTTGVVTHVVGNGFYLQDALGDGDDATSDAVFVFAGSNFGSTGGVAPEVGDVLSVHGTVSEFTPGGAGTRNLSTTQIGGAISFTVTQKGADLPAAVVIGAAGRKPPTEVIDSGALGANFDPVNDGIDFFESLEGMRVTVDDPLVVAATNGFGELFTVVDGGADATGLSARGALTIAPDDFNPEKVQIQFGGDFPTQAIDTGALLEDVTGVVSYAFGNFEVLPTEAVVVAAPSTLVPTVATLAPEADRLTIASYNVLNLDPNDADGDEDVALGRFDAIAAQIVDNLNAPDIVALQEVQDDSGSVNDGTVSASQTLAALAAAIVAAGGPAYEALDNPFIGDGLSGGQPGGNIRTAYLYNPARVDFVDGSLATIGGQAPGEAFAGARLPLVADFVFNGETVTVVNNHFSSKGGSAAILGVEQPFDQRQDDPTINGSVDERQAQADAVKGFVDGVLAADADAKVVVLGDLNEFEFNGPVQTLSASLTNLIDALPREDRSTFNFQGNAQVLDHILVSDALAADAAFEIVRTNVEFAETPARASDHDPILASLKIGAPAGETVTIVAGASGVPGREVGFEVFIDGESYGRSIIADPAEVLSGRRKNALLASESFVFETDQAAIETIEIVFDDDAGPRRNDGFDANLFVFDVRIGDRSFAPDRFGLYDIDQPGIADRASGDMFWNGRLALSGFDADPVA